MNSIRSSLFGFAVAALVALRAVAPAAAQTAAPETAPVIAGIAFTNRGPGMIDLEYLGTQVSLRVGEPLQRHALNQGVRRLMDTGLFSDVRVEVAPAGDGVAVVYSVVGKWRLEGLPLIVGARHFPPRRIEQWLGLLPGDPVDDALLGARTRTVLEEYRKDRFERARVEWTLEPGPAAEGRARLTVRVHEGSRTKIRRVRFEGCEGIPRRALLAAVRYPAWWNVLRFFRSLDHETPDFIAMRAAVRDAFANAGYLDAEVDLPAIEPGARGRPEIVVRVRAGRRYRLGALTTSGITLFPEAQAAARLPAQTGDVASMKALDEAARQIRDFFGSRGYLETSVRPLVTPDAQRGVADVRFEVREGRLTRMRQIRVEGNTRTRDKVIRRELLVYPGEIYDEVRVRRSAARVRNLGYFSRVDAYPSGSADDAERDLILEVEEKPTGQFMLGAGFSSVDRVIGYFEISQGNFSLTRWPPVGSGQKLKFRGQYGDRHREFDISFVEPWFLDRRVSLGLDLYHIEDDYSQYDRKRTGFSPSLAWPLAWNNRLELRYRIENESVVSAADTNAYTVVDTGEPFSFLREEDALESSLTLSLTHDTRDRVFIPTRGNLSGISGTVFGGPLGGDVDQLSRTAFAEQHVSPWFRHVLSLRGRYETIEAYGDTPDVSIANRFFLGGGRTLRGFDYRDVGPKAVRDSDPTYARAVGGRSAAYGSAEYTVPVFSFLRLAAFFDIGNAWLESNAFESGDLASSAGAGLRIDIPMFPIRLDRAWVLEPDDEFTGEDAWVFWIGR
jgi:outer membrane protein insertion porin family